MKFEVGHMVIPKGLLFSFALQAVTVCGVSLSGGAPLVEGQQAATVRNIHVTGSDQDLNVEISANKPIIPRTQTVTGPDRLIVDLPETRPETGLKNIPINRGILRSVRVALLSAHPPTTRVVLDLVAPIEYGVSPLANRVIVKLGRESGAASTLVVPTTDTSDVKTTEITAALPGSPMGQPSERSWARWIMPILVTTTILAMLVVALFVHLQNKRGRRGT